MSGTDCLVAVFMGCTWECFLEDYRLKVWVRVGPGLRVGRAVLDFLHQP